MTTILATAGVVALMAAVVGGGLQALGYVVPKLSPRRALALGALGVAFLIGAWLTREDGPWPISDERGQPACSDGKDNDNDGKTDYPRDPDCSSPDDKAEGRAVCADGKDNDSDGKIDHGDDPDCSSPEDNTEKPVPCSDGLDNDADGKIDHPDDPQCVSADDPAEKR